MKEKLTCKHLILAVLALVLLSLQTPIYAAEMTKIDAKASTTSQPAMMGAGQMPTARATSTSNSVWVYTDNLQTSKPVQSTGSFQLSVIDAAKTKGNDTAKVVASFNYPADGPTYTVSITEVMPASDFGGVAILRPIFGNTMVNIPSISLPRTMAHVIVQGNATIMKNNDIIASNQPAFAIVSEALHEADSSNWLSSPDSNRREAHILVPGSLLEDGTALSDFPNGFVYAYWPDAAVSINNLGGVVSTHEMTITPAQPGRGPMDEIDTSSIRKLNITLTNDRIVKAEAKAPSGLYRISVTNNSSRDRGLYFTGTDLCCTQYHRYSNILKPGQTQSFMFYFAPGKVTMRDWYGGRKTEIELKDVNWGPNKTSIVFE